MKKLSSHKKREFLFRTLTKEASPRAKSIEIIMSNKSFNKDTAVNFQIK